MSKEPYYWGEVTLTDNNEFTMIKPEFDCGASRPVNELLELEIVQDLISGKVVTLTRNFIHVNVKNRDKLPKLSKVINIAHHILQETFQMECDDEHGLHRTIVPENVKVYPCPNIFTPELFCTIQFDLVARLIEIAPKKLTDKIKREGFVELKPGEFMNLLNFYKLAHDNPNEYKITRNLWRHWVHQRKPNGKKLWDYYASQIWNSTKYDETVTRLMKISCPNLELRKKIQKINSNNDNNLKDIPSDLKYNAINLEALKKLSELMNDKTFPENISLAERVGSFIVQQIRDCPEKYLNSEFSSIKDFARKISG